MFVNQSNALTIKRRVAFLVVLCLSMFLVACGGSSNNDDTGFIKFYNGASDSPAVFLTIDEDLQSDNEDEVERTLSGVTFGNAGSRVELGTQSYFIELAWQDEESSARTDLEIVFESQVSISRDETQWIFMTNSINDPVVQIFSVPEITERDAEDDRENDLFNVRSVNLHPTIQDIDIYMSTDDQTFNEAFLVSGVQSGRITENNKVEQDQYVVYITASGSNEVLFESEEISFFTGAQYILVARPNEGIGGSEFVLDVATNTRVVEFEAESSVANISVYNGLNFNDLVPDFDAVIDFSISGRTSIPLVEGVPYAGISDTFVVESSDYRLSVFNNSTQEPLLQNRLISAPQSSDQTVFLYWTDEAVDDDDDGIVDENEDGIIDELKPIVSSLVIENSNRSRLFDKELVLLNLLNTDDFPLVTFYFVEDNEIIDTTDNERSVVLGGATSIILLNNTYQLFVVAEIDNNDIVLFESTVVLEDDTDDLFLILEDSLTSPSGYEVRIVSQVSGLDVE